MSTLLSQKISTYICHVEPPDDKRPNKVGPELHRRTVRYWQEARTERRDNKIEPCAAALRGISMGVSCIMRRVCRMIRVRAGVARDVVLWQPKLLIGPVRLRRRSTVMQAAVMNHDERFACEPTHGICQRLCATQGYGAGSRRTRTAYIPLTASGPAARRGPRRRSRASDTA